MNRNRVSTSNRESFWGPDFPPQRITVARQLVTCTRFTLHFTDANISFTNRETKFLLTLNNHFNQMNSAIVIAKFPPLEGR